jgi:hypothetical protein
MGARIREFLKAAQARPRATWMWLLIYAAAVTFPHELVQKVVIKIADALTRPGLYIFSATVALALAAIVSAILLPQLRSHPERRRILVYWTLTGVLIWCTWRFFTSNNTELVHYPQYFPEGAVLFALTGSPVEALAFVAILGGLDESYQYWALYPHRPSSLDFNDIYMDLLGGAAGVVFAFAFLSTIRKPAWKRAGVIAFVTIIGAGIGLWGAGVMALHQDDPHPHWFALSREKTLPFWAVNVPNGPNTIHELNSVEGVALVVATIALYLPLRSRR